METNINNGNGGGHESLVVATTSLGMELRGTPVRLNRFGMMFEIYGPNVIQLSEVLTDFRLLVNGAAIYSGQATVRNLMNTGQVVICEVTLNDSSWRDVTFDPALVHNGAVKKMFNEFFGEWQRIYKVAPEYKMVIGDIQAFLTDLRLWVEQLELGIRSMPAGDRNKAERDLAENLVGPVSSSLNHFFEKFELTARKVGEDLQPLHGIYARRQLHPLLLCSPFMHRIFRKPLGYAGDYEMVNMILRDPHEGGSLFSKVLNRWFLSQTPAEAHRNRVKYLTQRIAEECLRMKEPGRRLRVFDIGCGPAGEVEGFLKEYNIAERAEFTLLDFNEETLAYTESVLTQAKQRYQRTTPVRMVKKSVVNLIKAASRSADQQYDLIYCAGLFDYLQDRVCKQVMNLMYEMLAPGGLMIATNVDAMNPIQHIMGLIFEWHLVYRNHDQFSVLVPDRAQPDCSKVFADITGCNIFIEVRKPVSAAS